MKPCPLELTVACLRRVMSRPFRPWLAVGSVAAAVNVIFVVESHRDVFFRFPLIDASTYHRLATLVAGGGGFPVAPFWQPPLYPALLSVLYRCIGSSILAVRLVHGLTGVGTALLSYAIARRLAGRRSALVAALLLCVHGPLLFFHSQLLPTGLAILLTTAVVLAALRALERPSLRRVAVCGGLLGLAAINVPTVLVLLPLIAGILLWPRPTGSTAAPTRLALAAALGLAVLLPIVPVTLRNVVVSGEWVPISTNTGINLFIGNNPDWKKTIAIRPGLDWNRLVAEPFRRGGCRTEHAADAWFLRRVTSYAVREPAAFARGLIVKAATLCQSREIPRNMDLYVMRRHSRVLGALVWRAGSFGFPFGLIGPLAAAGLALTARRSRAHACAAGAVLLYGGAVALFVPAARYIAPVMPIVVVFAAIGAVELCRLWRGGGRGRLAAPAVALVAAAMSLPVRLPTDGIGFASELAADVGVALQVRGQTQDAIARYIEAVRSDPNNADAWFYMGTAYRTLGEPEKAILCHNQALRARPDHNRAMNDQAVLLFETGRKEEALVVLRRSLTVEPADRKTMRNLAIGLLSLGRLDEGNAWLTRAGDKPVTAEQLRKIAAGTPRSATPTNGPAAQPTPKP